MRYLIVVLVLLLPAMVFAAEKSEYILNCELISGGQCKEKCSESDVMVKQVEALGGEKKGALADAVCPQGKELKCCVDKGKIGQ